MKKNKQNINDMDYSSFVGLIKERNRPSGGIKTVHDVAINALIDKNKKILEIGSNTGFTSVNMSLLTGCKSVGVDINQNSVTESIRYAKENNITKSVKFICADTRKLPFKDGEFDIIWVSNVTSFIAEKESAIQEYIRVLRPGGTLVVVPIYYIKPVPDTIINEVSKAIGSLVEKWDKGYWLKLFIDTSNKQGVNLELYYEKDFKYLDRTNIIPKYVSDIIDKNIKDESIEIKAQINKRFQYFMNLFNENLQYCGFSILLFQKRHCVEESELFLSRPVENI